MRQGVNIDLKTHAYLGKFGNDNHLNYMWLGMKKKKVRRKVLYGVGWLNVFPFHNGLWIFAYAVNSTCKGSNRRWWRRRWNSYTGRHIPPHCNLKVWPNITDLWTIVVVCAYVTLPPLWCIHTHQAPWQGLWERKLVRDGYGVYNWASQAHFCVG